MKLLTINQAAEVVSLSRWTITEMLETGALPGMIIRAGRRKKVWRIREDALQTWITAKEEQTKKLVQGSNGARRLQAM